MAKTRRHADAPAQHGTPAKWRVGCRCDECRAAHNLDTKIRRQAAEAARWATLLPKRSESAMLRKIAAGARLEDVVPDGVTATALMNRRKWDQGFADRLDAALMAGRDPGLAHGTEAAYRQGKCRCPECRDGRADRRAASPPRRSRG